MWSEHFRLAALHLGDQVQPAQCSPPSPTWPVPGSARAPPATGPALGGRRAQPAVPSTCSTTRPQSTGTCPHPTYSPDLPNSTSNLCKNVFPSSEDKVEDSSDIGNYFMKQDFLNSEFPTTLGKNGKINMDNNVNRTD